MQHLQYFLQQIIGFKLLFFFFLFENITIIIFLLSITGCNNLLLSISCKSVMKNIVDVAFFSIFYFFSSGKKILFYLLIINNPIC